ncbi:MAG: nickel pincer cofactor biosynthesis protein LarC [Candidatus Hydrothermarchaeaceae archaeon]
MKFAYVDPSFSGVSGDMLSGALLGLAEGEDQILRVADSIKEELDCAMDVRFKRKRDVHSSVLVEPRIKGGRKYDLEPTIRDLAEKLELGVATSSFCRTVAETIVEAEQAVHKSATVELHELGSPDTLLDILSVAVLGEGLGFFDDVKVYSSPIKVGSGHIDSDHGRLPTPAPVTLEILKRYEVPFFIGGEGELATPTGVALLANLAEFASMPPARVIASGAGSGTFKKKEDNVLRIIMCEASDLPQGTVSVLETSVDDVSGEVLGYTLERLYEVGALDVQIIPTITKKNRPGYIIEVVCEVGAEETMADVLISETGTLGIRISTAHKRFQLERELKNVDVSLLGYEGRAKVKIARHGKRVINLKAEFEDARRISKSTGLPLRRVLREIEEQAKAGL